MPSFARELPPLPQIAVPENIAKEALAGVGNSSQQAERNLDTLFQRYHKESNELMRSEIKDRVILEIVDRSGIDYDIVNDFVKQWAISANDNDYRSMYIQKIASERYGIPLSTWQKERLAFIEKMRMSDMKNIASGEFHKVAGSHSTLFENFTKADGTAMYNKTTTSRELHEKILDAMYTNTQSALAKEGIKGDVWIYRGIGLDEPIEGGTAVGYMVTIESNAISSWTLKYETAKNFANGANQYVFAIRVPVERLLSTSLTGNGCLHEWEVTLLGNSFDQASILWQKVLR
jgi:hypothetical protein